MPTSESDACGRTALRDSAWLMTQIYGPANKHEGVSCHTHM